MEMTITAKTTDEIGLLARCVAAVLATKPFETTEATQVAQTAEAQTAEAQTAEVQGAEIVATAATAATAANTQTTEKRGRGRPRKTETTAEVSAATETPVVEDAGTVTSPADAGVEYEDAEKSEEATVAVPDLDSFRKAVVAFSDKGESQQKFAIATLTKVTTDGSPKTASVPEGARAAVLAELAKFQTVE